jgi:DNA-binding PadR family transcriptional regulator
LLRKAGLDPDELEFVVLSQVAYGLLRHGYGMATSINERYGTNFKSKQLYPVLKKLEASGFTTSAHSRGLAGPGMYVHTITEAGCVQLLQLEIQMQAKAERIRRSLEFVGRNRKADNGERDGIKATKPV